MNNLRRIIRQLLSESKREYTSVLQQYQSKGFSQEEIVKILEADPTNSGGTKNTLYSRWMVQQVLEKNESFEEVVESIKQYHNFYRKQEYYKNKGAPEIELQPPFSKRMSLSDLRNWIEYHPQVYEFSKFDRSEKYEEKSKESGEYKRLMSDLVILKGADQVYEDEEWRIVIPYTAKACRKIGIGTQHCVVTGADSIFSEYASIGYSFFYVIQKEAEQLLKRKFIEAEQDESKRKDIYSDISSEYPNWKSAWQMYTGPEGLDGVTFPPIKIYNSQDKILMVAYDKNFDKDVLEDEILSDVNKSKPMSIYDVYSKIAFIYRQSEGWSKNIVDRLIQLSFKNILPNDKFSKTDELFEKIASITDPKFINQLAHHENHFIKVAAAGHLDLQQRTIEILADNEDIYVRAEIAKRYDLSQELIEKLANDKHYVVRKAVAEHDDLSQELIEELANDESKFVREIIAKRNDISQELIEKLANDDKAMVRYRIAKRDDLSLEIIEKLADDDDSMVRELVL